MLMSINNSRNSNIELFRIVVMMSIVASHYVHCSGVCDQLSYNIFDWHSTFLWVFGMWGKLGINCFLLITGFFMCTSKITLRKFLKLILEVEFYKLIIFGIFLALGKEQLTLTRILNLLPICSLNTNDFVSCFLVLFLLIPFLNRLIQNISQKEHLNLLILCVGIFCLWDFVPKIQMPYQPVLWYMVMYLTGAYIKLYTIKNKTLQWFIGGNAMGTIIMFLLSILSVIVLVYLHGHGFEKIGPYLFVSDSQAPLAYFTSIALFNCFKTMHIRQNRLINILGACSFGVLLIHSNSSAIREWIWYDLLNCTNVMNQWYMPIHAILSVIGIYATCSIIDYLRICTLEKFTFRIFDKYIK